MAIVFHPPEAALEPLDLKAFFLQAADVDILLPEDERLAVYAQLLGRLSATKDLVWTAIEALGPFEKWIDSLAAPQSMMLGRQGDLAVRANVWLPFKKTPFSNYEQEVYAYDLAHNHDFRFLTVGHFGPGYATDLYEIEVGENYGKLGPVALLNHRSVRLTEGTVIFFERYKDVHVQHEPDALSISLNLILPSVERTRDQLFFDLSASHVVEAGAASLANRRMNALKMAALMGGSEVIDQLQEVAGSWDDLRVRRQAADALAWAVD